MKLAGLSQARLSHRTSFEKLMRLSWCASLMSLILETGLSTIAAHEQRGISTY